jgi:predicted dithiol-disulfide oxidoreductase (DUF899 family)
MEHRLVGANEWLKARRLLLEEEKALTRAREALAERRRALPWIKIENAYEFFSESGKCSLGDLFQGKSQLIVQHFMFGPDWAEGCPSCSYMADSYGQMSHHLSARDVAFVAVSRAPLDRLLAYRDRMGWQFQWVSSLESGFNFDFNVSFDDSAVKKGETIYNYRPSTFPSEEAPGVSVFFKDEAGTVFHTYSSYARGLDDFIMTYRFLDIVPKGRDEDAFAYPMEWVHRHDQY